MVRINVGNVRWRVYFDVWQARHHRIRNITRLPNDEDTAHGDDRIAFFSRYINEHRIIKQLEVCDVSFGILYTQQDRSAGIVDYNGVWIRSHQLCNMYSPGGRIVLHNR